MVTKQVRDGKIIYICTSCGLGYDDILIAFACEQYFREYGESSTDIMRRAVYRPNTDTELPKRAFVR